MSLMKQWMAGVRGSGMTRVVAMAVIALGVPREASAQLLLGTTGFGSALSTLVELDPDTGALVRTIGPVGYVVNGLSYDRTTGTLYASTSFNDPTYNGLIVIDRTTGAGTPAGVPGWGLPGAPAVTNIKLNAAGQMYGWWAPSEDDLISIDKTTGLATRVGESGLGTGGNGLAFDITDTLYMVNSGGSYYTVDTATGAATAAGTIGVTAHHGDFRPVSNLYYGIDASGGSSPAPRNLILANLATGTVTGTLPTVDDLHTLAFVPEPSSSSVAVAALLGLGSLGSLLRRRTKG